MHSSPLCNFEPIGDGGHRCKNCGTRITTSRLPISQYCTGSAVRPRRRAAARQLPVREARPDYASFTSLPVAIAACPFRGGIVDHHGCQLCGPHRGVLMPVAECQIHGTCTPRKFAAGQPEQSCLSCDDWHRPPPVDGD